MITWGTPHNVWLKQTNKSQTAKTESGKVEGLMGNVVSHHTGDNTESIRDDLSEIDAQNTKDSSHIWLPGKIEKLNKINKLFAIFLQYWCINMKWSWGFKVWFSMLFLEQKQFKWFLRFGPFWTAVLCSLIWIKTREKHNDYRDSIRNSP